MQHLESIFDTLEQITIVETGSAAKCVQLLLHL